jgi:hypothetical protein
VIETVFPSATAPDEKLAVTDARVTDSEPTFVNKVNEFDVIVADAEPSYCLFETANEPPIVRVFWVMFAVVVGAPATVSE